MVWMSFRLTSCPFEVSRDTSRVIVGDRPRSKTLSSTWSEATKASSPYDSTPSRRTWTGISASAKIAERDPPIALAAMFLLSKAGSEGFSRSPPVDRLGQPVPQAVGRRPPGPVDKAGIVAGEYGRVPTPGDHRAEVDRVRAIEDLRDRADYLPHACRCPRTDIECPVRA